MIVTDASAVLELLLRTPAGDRVRQRLFKRGETLHAPALIDIEVGQVLRRYARNGEITAAQGEAFVEVMRAFPVARYTHEALLSRVWQLRDHFTAYDAAYVALAEALDAPIVTCDARLAAAPGSSARIELVS